MKIKVLLFGITSDLLNATSVEIELPNNCTVNTFKKVFSKKYTALQKISSYAIAINENYATNETTIKSNDTIAIIPPVSGG